MDFSLEVLKSIRSDLESLEASHRDTMTRLSYLEAHYVAINQHNALWSRDLVRALVRINQLIDSRGTSDE